MAVSADVSAGDSILSTQQTALRDDIGLDGNASGHIHDGSDGRRFPDGSAASPAISATNFTTTGLYWAAGPTLGLTVNGAVQVSITATDIDLQSNTLSNVGATGNDIDSGGYNAVDGSNSAPAYSFTNDTNNGMYLYGTDQVGISAGGNATLRVDESGRIKVMNEDNANDTTDTASLSLLPDTRSTNFGASLTARKATADWSTYTGRDSYFTIDVLNNDGGVEGFRILQGGGIVTSNLKAATSSTDVHIDGGNELHSVSSSRFYKSKERALSVDTSRIFDLVVKTFEWNGESGSPGVVDHSLIAEDVYKVFPEIVNLRPEFKTIEVSEGGTMYKRDVPIEGTEKPYSIRNTMLTQMMLVELQKLKIRVDNAGMA